MHACGVLSPPVRKCESRSVTVRVGTCSITTRRRQRSSIREKKLPRKNRKTNSEKWNRTTASASRRCFLRWMSTPLEWWQVLKAPSAPSLGRAPISRSCRSHRTHRRCSSMPRHVRTGHNPGQGHPDRPPHPRRARLERPSDCLIVVSRCPNLRD